MTRLLFWLYNLLLVPLLVFFSPGLLLYLYRRQGNLVGLGERLAGGRRGRLPQTPMPAAMESSLTWFHGASVGEIRMLAPLVAAWRRRRPADRLLVTAMTTTGRATAAALFPVAEIRLLPFDLPWIWRDFLRCYRPERLIVAETELWPNLLAAMRAHRIPVALVNARLSEKSFRGYRRISFFSRLLFAVPGLVAAQDEVSAHRFVALGSSPQRVVVCGNLKFDLQPDAVVGRRYQGIFPPGCRILVAGSTHPGEEELILAAWRRARRRTAIAAENICLVLAPRHPQRFAAVAAWLAKQENGLLRFSRLKESSEKIRLRRVPPLLLLDTLGDLGALYPQADAALLGGTLVPGIGGHNPLEAAVWGRAVIHGPHTANFAAGYRLLDTEGGGLPVTDEKSLEALFERFLKEPAWIAAEGRRAARTMARRRGATAVAMRALEDFFTL